MAPQSVHKTKRPDDSPIVEEVAIMRLERMQQVIKVSQESVLTALEVVEEARKIRARTLKLKNRLANRKRSAT